MSGFVRVRRLCSGVDACQKDALVRFSGGDPHNVEKNKIR